MKILANDGISAIGKTQLEAAGFTVITDKVEQENIINYVNSENIEVILVRSATTVRKEVIDACPGIKLIGRGGVGMDNIDVAYAREKGIKVVNTPASSSQSVAELVLGHFFVLSRSLHDSFKNIGTGDFSKLKKKYAKGTELRGKNLTIIGFGRIGQSLATYAIGCGINVTAVDHHLEEREISLELGNGFKTNIQIKPIASVVEGIKNADLISLHVPKQKDGSAVIGQAEFDLMKDGVIIVNAARGGVIDENALFKALDSGKVAAIGLDVYENEPNPLQSLLTHDKIACTPHIGAATLEAQDRIGSELADLIKAEFQA
jgi:D-3-phosphoglycerate dehydrogenase / 2-oxoglutarate reductase